jgi:hypothetical protein
MHEIEVSRGFSRRLGDGLQSCRRRVKLAAGHHHPSTKDLVPWPEERTTEIGSHSPLEDGVREIELAEMERHQR